MTLFLGETTRRGINLMANTSFKAQLRKKNYFNMNLQGGKKNHLATCLLEVIMCNLAKPFTQSLQSTFFF